jgi:pimeloyl-ACP methyl ester carboxylesterase
MERLAEAGFRAVAPWTRGIYPTAEPADGDYSPLELGRDVLGLLSALSGPVAGIVGHDWGAMSAYAAANLSPELVPKMVVEAIPHPRAIRMNPALMRRTQEQLALRDHVQAHALVTRKTQRRAFAQAAQVQQAAVQAGLLQHVGEQIHGDGMVAERWLGDPWFRTVEHES